MASGEQAKGKDVLARSTRFGVSFNFYGGASWEQAELSRTLAAVDIPILEIRGCAYPEMARAEQVRQARLGGIETVVFLDSHVTATLADIELLVERAEVHGVAIDMFSEGLECAAVSSRVIAAMIDNEERRYGNSAVDAQWSGEKVPAVPLASPWHRNGESLVPGEYLTDGEAFLWRARKASAELERVETAAIVRRPKIRFRAANVHMPKTHEPGSHFALCIPSFGRLDLDQHAQAWALEKAGMTVFQIHDCAWIDQARSWLAMQALSVGKGCFFLDHDIVFHPNDVLRLCEQALERDIVAAGAYCMRRSGKNIIGSLDVEPGFQQWFEGGSTLPAFYSGLGFAAVPHDVLDEIELPTLASSALSWGLRGDHARSLHTRSIRPWFALDCSTGFYAGEDVSFCNRVHDLTVKMHAREPGFEPEWGMTHSGRPARVFIDTRVRIMHRGQYDYGIEDAGIVVPRIESMKAILTGSRKEAREILINALELPVDVKLDMQEFPEA